MDAVAVGATGAGSPVLLWTGAWARGVVSGAGAPRPEASRAAIGSNWPRVATGSAISDKSGRIESAGTSTRI
ncbi:MAG: hypothetical protein ACYCUF_05780, partial [Acidimicrobiales bacterium]